MGTANRRTMERSSGKISESGYLLEKAQAMGRRRGLVKYMADLPIPIRY
jgi:hypothetical protein